MLDKDRIRLAEAMGRPYEWHDGTTAPNVFRYFDPFTDANDDYAVLEHMLDDPDISTEDIDSALDHLGYGHRWAIEVGTWARVKLCLMDRDMDSCEDCAALKVIDETP